MSTFIIAEAGSTWRVGHHKHHLQKAVKCIHLAKECGADACKFQWTSDPNMLALRRRVAAGTYDILAWPAKWLPFLAAECEAVGIEFLCTVFLPCDVAMIAPHVKRFKIASLEAMDLALFDECERHQKPIIMSTGALDRKALEILDSELGSVKPPVQLLHCVAAYPSPIEAMNLRILDEEPSVDFAGLSDHSGNELTGAVAVACGARIIEVHMRLDETRKDNPDYGHSLSPMRLKQYIANIRTAERMLGDGIRKLEPCEVPMLRHQVTR